MTFSRHFLVLFGLLILTLPCVAENAASKEIERLLDEGARNLAGDKAKAACRAYEKAVELSKGLSYDAQIGLASAQLKADNPKSARLAAVAAEKLASGEQEKSPAAFLTGLSLYKLSQDDVNLLAPAAEALERAAALDPRAAAHTRLTLAFVREAQGQDEEAIALLEEAISALPKGDKARTNARISFCDVRNHYPQRERPPLEPLQVGNEVSRPVQIFSVEPNFSLKVRANQETQKVLVQAIIDRAGCIRATKVLKKSSDEFDASVVAAMRQWVFEPVLLDGKPVDVYYNLNFRYRLADKD